MTNQSTTGTNLTAIPTEAISRNIAFLSQVMMGKLQQNASLLIAALSTLSVSETSLSMSSARSSARDALAGGIASATGSGVSGLVDLGAAANIGKEMHVQRKANKAYEARLNEAPASSDPEAVINKAKATPEAAKNERDAAINESNKRVEQTGLYARAFGPIAQAVGGVVKSGFDASAQLEQADQKLAEQVASALMNTLNTIVNQVTGDYSQNNPYGALANLAN